MTTPAQSPVRMTFTSVNFDAVDPDALAAFWAGAIGGTVAGRFGQYVMVSPPEGGGWPNFLFQQQADKQPGRNTIHIDFDTEPGDRSAEIERLLALGASRQYDVDGEIAGVDWTTLADPEGNLFCVGSPTGSDD